MTAVVGRAWGWVRSWGGGGGAVTHSTAAVMAEGRKSTGSRRGWTSWIWGGWKCQGEEGGLVEEFWEAQEKLQPLEVEDLGAGRPEADARGEQVSRWWNKYLPTSYLPWPRKAQACGPRRRKRDGQSGDRDVDGDFSDYGTPPPSPTPPSPLTSPFRVFAHGWNVEIVPEHYEICFNFIRHLFDLFVVGFLSTVSPPVKLVLEVLGVQGALRLWFHGMAMFFVSTVGMAGLLWLIQEYLPEFALIYGIVQAIVISVSVKQSVLFGMEDEKEQKEEEEGRETDDVKDRKGTKENYKSAKDKLKTS